MNIKKKNTLLRTILIPIFILTVMTSVNAEDEDQDQDGIPDLIDNCTELKMRINVIQMLMGLGIFVMLI